MKTHTLILSMAGLFLTALIFTSANSFAEDEWQYWNRNNFVLYAKDRVSYAVLTDTRFNNDFRRVGLNFISPRVKYKAHDNLDLQLNLTYLTVRSNSRDDFGFQYRIEPEINPHFALTDWLKVYFRNRTEFRWIENQGSYNTRYRGRLRFTVPVKDMGALKSFFADSEFFYDFAENDHTEQRTTPVGVNFALTEKTDLQLFYMIQHKRGVDDWNSNQVLGSMLTVRF